MDTTKSIVCHVSSMVTNLFFFHSHHATLFNRTLVQLTAILNTSTWHTHIHKMFKYTKIYYLLPIKKYGMSHLDCNKNASSWCNPPEVCCWMFTWNIVRLMCIAVTLDFFLYGYIEKVMEIKLEMDLYCIKGNCHVIKVLYKAGTNTSAIRLSCARPNLCS